MNKVQLIRQHIDVAKGRGLEIGPLTAPVVTRDLGEIFYADHATTEELREWYRRDPAVDENAITPIDFVWGARTLAEAVGSAAPFDYVVASHVLEHVPDLVGWLKEVSAVLRPGGRLSVWVPDRRFTFDVRRRETDIADIVEAHLLGLRRPAVRATFDHFYRIAQPVDTRARWRGERGHDDPPLNMLGALEIARTAATTTEYIDTHCWIFSDASFAELMRELMQVGLIDLRFVAFTPTRLDELEFFATLERPADDCPAEERIHRNVASVPDVSNLGGPWRTDDVDALKARIKVLEVAVSSLKATAEKREAHVKQLEAALFLMECSTSWRITAPLRRVRNFILGKGKP
jgi:SAM-dependent methyltransferase